MHKKLFLFIFLSSLLLAGCSSQPTSNIPDRPTENTNQNGEIHEPNKPNQPDKPSEIKNTLSMITVKSPNLTNPIESPLKIEGEVSGTYFNEALFTIILKDANEKEIGRTEAHATGDWMTEEKVPFEATLNFQEPETKTGILIFEKANPSGLPENAYSEQIEIRFDE